MKNKIIKNCVLAVSFLTLPLCMSAQTADKYIRKQSLVKYHSEEFVLRVDIQIPVGHLELQKFLAGKLFDSDADSLYAAYGIYMNGMNNVDKLPPNLVKYNCLSIGSKQIKPCYNGRISTYLYYVTRTINNPLAAAKNYLPPREIRGYITYDEQNKKVMTVADFLPEEVIRQNKLDGTGTDVRIKGDTLICRVALNAEKTEERLFPLSLNDNTHFSAMMKQLTKEDTVKKVPDATQSMNDRPFDIVELMPEFPGGTGKMMEWLSKNIKYPARAEENGVQGRVIVRFVVDKDGSIINASIVRSVDPSLDMEALRVVKAMPRWIPGRQKGEAVSVWYTLPVTFQLQDTSKKNKKKK